MIELSWIDLSIAATLVLSLSVLSIAGNFGVARSILIAATRTVIQLVLLGLVLKLIFENTQLIWVACVALIMTLVAGREVTARQKYRFRGWWSYIIGLVSMSVSSVLLTVISLLYILNTDPWYAPQYAIPILGMLLGNTMTSIALGLDNLTRNARDQKEIIEAKLLLGYSATEAIHTIKQESFRVSLIPIINAMVAAGIISLPGMMTGQILAGAAPEEAAKYQILIMFLITAGAGYGSLIAIQQGCKRLFDAQERLRLDRLS